MMKMNNENYEIIQKKKIEKKNENFQMGRVIHMADNASSPGILEPELHVTVREQLLCNLVTWRSRSFSL